MAEKDVAREADLEAHKKANPTVVHGIIDVVRSLIAAAVTLVRGALVYDNIANAYLVNPLEQHGYVAAATTSVTFDIAFKAGTTPAVQITGRTNTARGVTFNIESVSNTGFTSYGMYHDGSASQQAYYWRAVGEKA